MSKNSSFKILVVDDQEEVLRKIQNEWNNSSNPNKDDIDLICYGIDTDETPPFDEQKIVTRFCDFAKNSHFDENFDIILLDFHTVDEDGLSVFDFLTSQKFKTPIIVMLDKAAMVEKAIFNALKEGAKRYLYKNTDITDELIVDTHQVMREFHNEQMLRFIEKLSQKMYRDLAHFASDFTTMMSDKLAVKCVIRQYDSIHETLSVLKKDIRWDIPESISKEEFPEIFEPLSNLDGIKIIEAFNIKELLPDFRPFGEDQHDIIRLVVIRIGAKEHPKGTISLFEQSNFFPLDKRGAKFIKFSLDLLTSKLELQEKHIHSDKILAFIKDTMSMEEKKDIVKAFLSLLHTLFHEGDDKHTTVSIKLFNRANGLLECHDYCGIERQDQSQSLDDPYISSTVFRTDIPIWVEDMENIETARERFRNDYVARYGFYPTQNEDRFEFFPSAQRPVRSELCIPLSIKFKNSVVDVLGVLNLESTKVEFYTKEVKKSLEILTRTVAVRIDNINYNKRLNELANTGSLPEKKERLSSLLRLFKDLIPYYMLSSYIRKDGRIIAQDMEIDPRENRADVKQEIESLFFDETYKNSFVPTKLKEIRDANPIYLTNLESYDNYISLKSIRYAEIKAILIQPLYVSEQLVGWLVVRYAVDIVLTQKDKEFFGKIAQWIGHLYLSEEEAKGESDYFFVKRFSEKFESNFRHTVSNHIKKVEEPMVKLSSFDSVSTNLIQDTLNQLQGFTKYHEQVMNCSCFLEIIDVVKQEFANRLTTSSLSVDATSCISNPLIHERSKMVVYIALFHILDNAFDALIKEVPFPRIEIRSIKRERIFDFSVCNNGPKIKEPDKIFQKNYTTKATQGGTGLYSAKEKFLEYHGDIKVTHNEEGRVCFTLSLPIKENTNEI